MKPYEMKDLGYQRTPCNHMLVVEFSNGELWEVPAQVVIDSRDENYADDEEDTSANGNVRYDVTDWASNNMNWSDLQPYARKIDRPPVEFNYEEDWGNADKKVMVPK